MKILNKTEWGVPDWPEFREYRDGYSVEGFCRDYFDEDYLWIIAVFCGFVGMMLAGMVHDLTSKVGLALPPIFLLLLILAPPGGCLFYFYRLYGKQTKVIFLPDAIILHGRTNGRLPVLKDQIAFRMRPHHKIRMRKRMQRNEAEKLQDYAEIVLEYGLQTFEVCNIANLQQAQVFTRVLNDGFKRSQELRQNPEIAMVSSGQSVDPDDLPE